jgi:hypothetical protein
MNFTTSYARVRADGGNGGTGSRGGFCGGSGGGGRVFINSSLSLSTDHGAVVTAKGGGGECALAAKNGSVRAACKTGSGPDYNFPFSCTACEPGFFSTNGSECSACPGGTFSSSTGATSGGIKKKKKKRKTKNKKEKKKRRGSEKKD